MENNKETTTSEKTKENKRNIEEVAVTSRKLGLMTRFNFILVLLPFVIWTGGRYWKGGYPLGQIGLYILFLAAVFVGQTFLCTFYAEYDHDRKKLTVGQHLFRFAATTIELENLNSVNVHTVEIADKRIVVDGFKRSAKGKYTVYRITDGSNAANIIDLWLEKSQDAENFDTMLHKALAETNKENLYKKYNGIVNFQEYKELYTDEK
ncbi:MAG: hypothetical protein ACTTKL_05820 [Treponema sp.]